VLIGKRTFHTILSRVCARWSLYAVDAKRDVVVALVSTSSPSSTFECTSQIETCADVNGTFQSTLSSGGLCGSGTDLVFTSVACLAVG